MDLLKKIVEVLTYEDGKDLYDLIDALYTFKADGKTLVGRITGVTEGVHDLPMIEVTNHWFDGQEITAILLCGDKSARLYFRKANQEELDFMKGSYYNGTIEIENFH